MRAHGQPMAARFDAHRDTGAGVAMSAIDGVHRFGALVSGSVPTFALALVIVLGIATAISSAAHAADLKLPDGPGADLVYARCRTCHDLQYLIDSAGLMPAQWDAVLKSMHDYGLTLPEAERTQILHYLSTWLGPNPPPATAAAPASGAPTAQAAPDGRTLYERNCSACHGADARGDPGRIPPLANNSDLRRDTLLPVLVVLHGLDGPIEVDGQHFDSSMPPFDHLSNEQIAAIVNFVRTEAAPDAPHEAVTAATVGAQREQALNPRDVHAWREQHL